MVCIALVALELVTCGDAGLSGRGAQEGWGTAGKLPGSCMLSSLGPCVFTWKCDRMILPVPPLYPL